MEKKVLLPDPELISGLDSLLSEETTECMYLNRESKRSRVPEEGEEGVCKVTGQPQQHSKTHQ